MRVLDDISITNFRGISSLKANLREGACLVGRNNAGKSTVLHAIRSILDPTFSIRDSDIRINCPRCEIELGLVLPGGGDGQVADRRIRIRLAYESGGKAIFSTSENTAHNESTGGGFVEAKKADIDAIRREITLVYIPAVREVTDEAKSAATATLGRLLRKALDSTELNAPLKALAQHLAAPDLDSADRRIAPLVNLEQRLTGAIEEKFPGASVKLDFSEIALKALLEAMTFDVMESGLATPLALKGDGLKRAVVFALLKELATSEGDSESVVLLYEEPELFLHPSAQRRLADEVRDLGRHHSVLVTTHSPLFACLNHERALTKLSTFDGQTRVHCVDLDGATTRDLARVLHYGNADAALFADRVILVEGPSDAMVYRHVLDAIGSDDAEVANWVQLTNVVEVGGKSQIREFLEFFRLFDITPTVIADLDILVEGLMRVLPNHPVGMCYEAIAKSLGSPQPSQDATREFESFVSQVAPSPSARVERGQLKHAAEQLLESLKWGREAKRRLRDAPPGSELAGHRVKAIEIARTSGVHILEHGELEDYYDSSIRSEPKTDRAMAVLRTPFDDLQRWERGSCLVETVARAAGLRRSPMSTGTRRWLTDSECDSCASELISTVG